jgi:acetyltransferase-like isoleucine patch superfamily enzyme
MKALLKAIVRVTKPYVQRLAEAYDLHVERPLHAHGQHPLIIEGDLESALHRIPKSVYFNTRSGSIRVGADTVFGERVEVLTGKHMGIAEAAAAGVPLHHVPESGRDIEIGAGCYIGTGAIIIGPVKIGDGAMIGAGAVVTHDIPPLAFAAGVPARVIHQPERKLGRTDRMSAS